jgi:tetratricopeptide (TPR) repeat protein
LSPFWTNQCHRVVILASLLMLGGCATLGSKDRSVSDTDGQSYPAAATNRYSRALGYMDAGDDENAVREFESFGSQYPEYSGALVNLGILHNRNGRPDAAMAALERAIAVCRTCAAANNQLGILQRQQGRFEEAEKSYLRAIAADPGYRLAYFNLGVLHDLYNGRPDLAVEYYESYLERESDPESRKLVEMWVVDLKRRFGETQRTAKSE